MNGEYEESQLCPKECGGILEYPIVEDCTCHLNPPCSACVDNQLSCKVCGFKVALPEKSDSNRFSYTQPGRDVRKTHTFEGGGVIFDWGYDSSSGSTMIYKGCYKGAVTSKDIISYFGDGTFGHRGLIIRNGRFTYTKITD